MRNLKNILDEDEHVVVKEFVRAASGVGCGWFRYWACKPLRLARWTLMFIGQPSSVGPFTVGMAWDVAKLCETRFRLARKFGE